MSRTGNTPKRGVRACGLLAIAAIWLAAAAVPAVASKIVYSCAPNLCAVDPDSGASTPITSDGASSAYRFPSISKNGNQVAAARSTDVVAAGAYGDNLTAVWGGSRDMNGVAISPNGGAVGESHSYVETRYGCPLTGGCLELVNFSDTFFQVGPDPATRFGSYPGGGGVGFLGGGSLLSSFYTLSTDTHSICVVADPTASGSTCEPRVVSTKTLFAPEGSPDGKLIAAAEVGTSGDPAVNLYDAGSGALVRPLGTGTDPTFSPDGAKVAYTAPDGWIEVVPTSGGAARRLVKGLSPSWGGGPGPGPAVTSKSASYRKGRVGIKLRCGGVTDCRGTLRIKAGNLTIGSRAFRLKGEAKAGVAVRLSERGREKLESSPPARVVVTLKPAKGRLVTTRLPLRR